MISPPGTAHNLRNLRNLRAARARDCGGCGDCGGCTPYLAGKTPAQWLSEALKAAGAGHIGTLWQCPAHLDPTPSLSVRDLPDGWAGVKCFAGCTTVEVLSALHLSRANLLRPLRSDPAHWPSFAHLDLDFPPLTLPSGQGSGEGWRFEAVHPYGNRWRLVRSRHASGQKSLLWETRDDRGAWIPGLRGTTAAELPLYFEHEAVAAVALGENVFVVESESSADALMASGRYVTTWAGGASSPPLDRLRTVLTDARAVLVPDNDPPGRACHEALHAALQPVTRSLVTVWPDEGQDARDLLTTNPGRLPR